MLATAGLTEADVKPVLVPNVVRSADEFIAGNCRHVLLRLWRAEGEGGRRHGRRHPARWKSTRTACRRPSKIMPWGYLTQIGPGPIFTGVEKPMKVYSFDNVIITSAKVPDDLVYKILDLMEKNKDDLVAVQPVLREWTPAFGYKQYGVPYHPGALKFFKETQSLAPAAGVIGWRPSRTGGSIMKCSHEIDVRRGDCLARSLAAAIAGLGGQPRLGADLRPRHHAAGHARRTRSRPPSPRR